MNTYLMHSTSSGLTLIECVREGERERGQVANVWLSSFILLVCLVFEVVINIKLISTVICSH